MRSNMHRLTDLVLELQLDLIQLHGAIPMLIGELDASTEVNRIDLATETFDDSVDHLRPWHDQAGTISTVRHGHNLDIFSVFGKLTALLTNPFETLWQAIQVWSLMRLQ